MSSENSISKKGHRSKYSVLKKPWLWVVVFLIIVSLIIIGLFIFRSTKEKGWISPPIKGVRAMAVDQDGNVWVIHQRMEIYVSDGRTLTIPLPENLEDDSIFSLTVDNKNQIWAGSFEGVIYQYDVSSEWHFFFPEDPEADNRLWEIAVDGKGRVWVMSNVGLGLLDTPGETMEYSYNQSGSVSEGISDLAVDKDGNLWVLDQGDLKKLGSSDEWETINTPDYVLAITGISFDDRGQLWVSNMNGISIYNNNSWIELLVYDATSPILFEYTIDDQGRLWGGTNYLQAGDYFGGLYMFDPEVGWTNYNSRTSGLLYDGIEEIVVDGEGQVWIDTNRGLSIFDIDNASDYGGSQSIAVYGQYTIPVIILFLVLFSSLITAYKLTGKLTGTHILNFAVGFLGWFLVNSLFWGFWALPIGEFMYALMICFFVPLPLNIILMIVLLVIKQRRWMAVGAFSALIFNMIISIQSTPLAGTYSDPLFDLILLIPFFMKSILGF